MIKLMYNFLTLLSLSYTYDSIQFMKELKERSDYVNNVIEDKEFTDLQTDILSN